MVFSVKYRDSSGAVCEKAVEAANRADCFAKCKEQGIVPMAVEAGAAAKKPAPASGSAASGKCRLVLLAAALAAIGAAVWMMLPNEAPTETAKPEKAKSAGLAAEVTPAKAPEPVAEPVKDETPPSPKRESLRDPGLSDERRQEMYEKKLAEAPLPEESTNRLFRTALEQVMGWVFTTQLGDMPPPLPPIPDYDLVHLEEILNQKTTIRDTDTDRQAHEKDIVDYVKKELKAFIDKGGDPEDFLKFYHDELKSAYQERSMAQQQVMKIIQEDPAVAVEYLKEVNESLAGKGIKGVVLPERTLKRMGINPEVFKSEGENKQ